MNNHVVPGAASDVQVNLRGLNLPAVSVQYKTNILKKNIVDGVNTLTQSMMNETNTKYVIKYDYVLGEDITVPANCVLEFDGGSLSNGTLIGTDTQILYVSSCFEDIDFAGSWIVPEIYSWILKDIAEEDKLRTLFKLQNDTIQNNVYIEDIGEPYIVVPSGNMEKAPRDGINVISNTNVYNSGSIKIKANSQYGYTIFNLNGDNICFAGGEIVGDKDEHDYSGTAYPSFEWGHGIYIPNTTANISVRNLTVHNCIGDGISIGGNNNILQSIKVFDCRRNGVTVSNMSDLIIEDFEIFDIIGTNPQCAIDIEPNSGESCNIIIRNGIIKSTDTTHTMLRGIRIYQGADSNLHDIAIERIISINVPQAIYSRWGQNISVKDCEINGNYSSNTELIGLMSTKNVLFDNIITRTNNNVQALKTTGSGNENIVVNNCNFINTGSSGDCILITGNRLCFTNSNILGYSNVFKAVASAIDGYLKFQDCEIHGHIRANQNLILKNCSLYDDTVASDDSYIIDVTLENLVVELINSNVTLSKKLFANIGSATLKAVNCKIDNTPNKYYRKGLTTTSSSKFIGIGNYGYKEIDYFGSTNGTIILDKGTIRPTDKGLSPTDEGFEFFDEDLRKQIYAKFIQGNAVISYPQIATNTVCVCDNLMSEDNWYINISPTTLTATVFIYASADNNASIGENDVLIVQSSMAYKTASFKGVSSTLYPYIKIKHNHASGDYKTGKIYQLDLKWFDGDGFLANKKSGTTANRPTDVSIGYEYFDTTLGKPIYASAISGDTVTWVDATGATV